MNKNEIESAISLKTANSEIFTAYDISKIVQSNCQTQGLPIPRHLNMKDDIHDVMMIYLQNNLYNRKFMRIDANHEALVYYPVNSDPNQYNTFTQNSSTQQANDDDKEDDSKNGRKPDKRGTLSVPKRLLETDFPPGSFVSIIESNGKIILTASTNGAIGNYKVDCHGNVRITSGVLKKCRNSCSMWSSSSSNSYDFEKENGNVVVKPA